MPRSNAMESMFSLSRFFRPPPPQNGSLWLGLHDGLTNISLEELDDLDPDGILLSEGDAKLGGAYRGSICTPRATMLCA